MKRYVYPSEPGGTVSAPRSKSVMQRAVAAALLAEGESIIANPSFCDDSLAAMAVAESLGASIKKYSDAVIIKGGLNPLTGTLNCGESGLCIRMFTPVAALTGNRITLTAEKTLLSRPVSDNEEALKKLGLSVISRNGMPPLEISSLLEGGEATIDGSGSSQLLTGLLIALPRAKKNSVITVRNLKSREYADITIDVLRQFGIEITGDGYTEYRINGNQTFKPSLIDIEGDWSGAAFLLCAGAIAGNVKVSGLNLQSSQPDRAIMEVLELAGADMTVTQHYVETKKSRLSGFDFDASGCPDLFPPIAALALYCEGESRIHGTDRLKSKESDRLKSILSEFGKMSADIHSENNTLIVYGSHLSGGMIDSHGDHRIAMACATAALGAKDAVEISGAECVNKSYREFFRDITKLGVTVK